MQDAQNYLEWPVKHSLLDWLTAVIWNQNSGCSDKSSLVSTNCELCKYYDDITSSTFYNQAFQMWHLMTDTLIYTFITTTHVYYTQINCYNLFSAFISKLFWFLVTLYEGGGLGTSLVAWCQGWRWPEDAAAQLLCCGVVYWLQLAAVVTRTRNIVMIPIWAAPSNSHSSSLPQTSRTRDKNTISFLRRNALVANRRLGTWSLWRQEMFGFTRVTWSTFTW